MSGETRRLAAGVLLGALAGDPARALPHLVVQPPAGPARRLALPAELTVGRGPEAGLVLSDAGVSRLHARLRLGEDGAAWVEDLGSKNGLRLNGARLGPGAMRLRPGDELLLGRTCLRLEGPGLTPASPPGPPGIPGTPGPAKASGPAGAPAARDPGSPGAAPARALACARARWGIEGTAGAAAALAGLAALLALW